MALYWDKLIKPNTSNLQVKYFYKNSKLLINVKCSLFIVAALKSGSSCSSAGVQKVTNTGMSDLAKQEPNETALPSPGPLQTSCKCTLSLSVDWNSNIFFSFARHIYCASSCPLCQDRRVFNEDPTLQSLSFPHNKGQRFFCFWNVEKWTWNFQKKL